MTPDYMIRLLREGLVLALILSAGPLSVATLTGLIVSVFGATTRIQEATFSFASKLIAVSLTLVILGPWMLNESVKFTRLLYGAIALIR